MLSGGRTKTQTEYIWKNSVNCIKIIPEVPRSVENDYLEVLNIFGISQEQLRISVDGGGDQWISSIFIDSRVLWWSEIVEWWSDWYQKSNATQKPQELPKYEVWTASQPGERSTRSLPILDILVFARSRLTWDLIWGGSWNFECPATKRVYLRAPMELWWPLQHKWLRKKI